jgi:hypothetical protein
VLHVKVTVDLDAEQEFSTIVDVHRVGELLGVFSFHFAIGGAHLSGILFHSLGRIETAMREQLRVGRDVSVIRIIDTALINRQGMEHHITSR